MPTELDLWLEKVKGKHIHVLGLSGIEGYSFARFLLKHGLGGFTAHDFGEEDEYAQTFNALHLYLPRAERVKRLQEIKEWPVKFHWGQDYLKGIEQADFVFVPQNWFAYSQNQPVVGELIKKHPQRILHLAGLYHQLIACPLIAVTGSMGKSTTTKLLFEIFSALVSQQPGLFGNVYYGGNDRRSGQFLEQLDQIKASDLALLEVSNRQLKFRLPQGPKVGVITNIVPNHIEDHGSLKSYIQTKASLIEAQREDDICVLNWDDENSRELASTHLSLIHI